MIRGAKPDNKVNEHSSKDHCGNMLNMDTRTHESKECGTVSISIIEELITHLVLHSLVAPQGGCSKGSLRCI